MLGRLPNSYLPYQINDDLNLLKNFRVHQQEADQYARRRGWTSHYDYREGDRVVLQDVKSILWDIKGTIVESRPSGDGTSPQQMMTHQGSQNPICYSSQQSERRKNSVRNEQLVIAESKV